MKTSPLLRFIALQMAFAILLGPLGYAQGEYTFVDGAGNEITLPENLPIYSVNKLGIWSEEAADFIGPKINSWIRKEGLEDIRVLTISANNPFTQAEEEKEKPYIKALYLIDKDGYILGYRDFPEDLEGPATEKFFLNGVINHIRIYVEFADHSLWETDYEMPFKK